jgi:hypothetical protein
VRQPDDTISAGEGAGNLSDVSRPLRDTSVPVHQGAQTIGESSSGSVHSGPVRDGSTRSMVSGPVSDFSQGPVSEPRPPLTGGSMTEASAGAVKHDIDSPLGERISEPLRELGPLQDAMRARREQAEQGVLANAMAPVAAPIADEPHGEADTEAIAPPVDEPAAADELAVPDDAVPAADEAASDEAAPMVDDEAAQPNNDAEQPGELDNPPNADGSGEDDAGLVEP